MNVRDWQDVSTQLLSPLYAREQQHWNDALFWDTRTHWTEIERARLTWGLPGVVACDDSGTPEGWCFYLRAPGGLQIGAIVADTPPATAAILDHVLHSREGAEPVSCFMPERAPGLVPALEARGFELEPHVYLSCDLKHAPLCGGADAAAFEAADLDPWDRTQLERTAELLRQSYTREAGRHFAANHEPEEWLEYVRNLVEQTGCGVFQPPLSRVAWANGRLAGAILMTQIDPHTAHVAQVAVHGSARGRGLGRQLLDSAMAAARAAGLERVTLLVSAANQAAMSLYLSKGFTARAAFVAGHAR